MSQPQLALFDLDGTLLAGDSDVLWCDFLIDQGLLDRGAFGWRNADMEARYQAGTVGAEEFAHFYLGLLAGQTEQRWGRLREEFLATQVVPRIPAGAVQLVRQHLDADDLVVMTTATGRYITELTAKYLHIEHLLAIEPELLDGRFTGRSIGTLNMRQGKVVRLHEWLAARGQSLARFHSTAYSDSINDLPLLEAVDAAVAVDPDPQLAAIARERGWRVLKLHGR